MSRPKDMPPKESYKHGTRARYVAGCRCRPCTHSNTVAYHEREAVSKAAALELDVVDGGLSPQTWTAPDGTKKVRMYKRACPGINGTPCPHGTHLRKDSTGGICGRCRSKLVWNGLVDAQPSRQHLKRMSHAGVGYRTVADAACIPITVIAKIISGKKRRVRAQTERAILEVDEGAMADHALVDAKPIWAMVHRLKRTHGYTKQQISKRIGQGGRALQLGKKQMTARNAMKIVRLLRDAEGDFLKGQR